MAALTQSEIAKKAIRCQVIYQQERPLFEAFRGGVPVALWVAMVQGESDGKMTSKGDSSIGEFGANQVTSYTGKSGKWEGTEAEFRVPKDTRKNKVGNYFLAGADFNSEAARLLLKFPGMISSHEDLYKLAHLVFAVGRGGAYRLISLAGLAPGPDVYGRLLAWAAARHKAGKLPQLSQSQPPAKVWRRLVAVDDRWKVAVASGLPMSAGPPILPAVPPSIIRFTVPSDLQGRIRQQAPGALPSVPRADLLQVTSGAGVAEGFAYGGPVGALYRWWWNDRGAS